MIIKVKDKVYRKPVYSDVIVGRKFQLYDIKGKRITANYWATKIGGEEMEYLYKYSDSSETRSGASVKAMFISDHGSLVFLVEVEDDRV